MSAMIDKIKKLLALAGNNSNDQEASRAMEMASALMMKHGIEADQLKDKKIELITGMQFADSKKFHKILSASLAQLMGCQGMWSQHNEAVSFMGRPENVEAAEQLHVFVILQIESLYKRSLPKGLMQRERASYRADFKMAAATRVANRVADILRGQSIDGSSESRALVVNHRSQLAAEIAEVLQGRKQARPTRHTYKSGDALIAGRIAGDQVELNKGVE